MIDSSPVMSRKRPALLLIIMLSLSFLTAAPVSAQGHDPDADLPHEEPAVETLALPVQPEAPEIMASPESLKAPVTEAVPEAVALEEPPAELQPLTPDTIVSAGVLVDGLEYDIPMPWGHEEFETLRASFLTPGGKKWLLAVMGQSMTYLGYVEERIEAYGLPRELAFLPVIESEYSPFAVSRSGATGIWQFMKNSISGYGMAISEWKDERKDFMKSTDAALRKLKDNYSALDDWLLALAAYNAGLGAVSRAIKSGTGEDLDFWHLYESRKLSREALSYVPKFLAVASILRYPELHGVPSEWGEKHEWEAVETSRQVDIAILAQKTGISFEVLKSGNAELKYSITPPSSHTVKVPADKADAVKELLADTSTPLVKYDIYKVKSGDTMGAIAQRYKTPLSMILDANPGVSADKIRIGQTLIIPHLPGTTVAGTAGQTGSDKEFSSSYSVRSGDTLWEIAIRFGVSPSLLADRNGIEVESILRIGQKLKVPAL